MNLDFEDSYLIVSRHPAAIEFIRNHEDSGYTFRNARVVGSATEEDVRDRHVAGNLPLHLASHALSVTAVEFETPPRGQEYGQAEMLASGARLRTFIVKEVYSPHYERKALLGIYGIV